MVTWRFETAKTIQLKLLAAKKRLSFEGKVGKIISSTLVHLLCFSPTPRKVMVPMVQESTTSCWEPHQQYMPLRKWSQEPIASLPIEKDI